MADARTLVDVNIAAGLALPSVSKTVRRAAIVMVFVLLGASTALAAAYRENTEFERTSQAHKAALDAPRQRRAADKALGGEGHPRSREREKLKAQISYYLDTNRALAPSRSRPSPLCPAGTRARQSPGMRP